MLGLQPPRSDEVSSGDDMPDLHRLEIVEQNARERFKARGGKLKQFHETLHTTMQGYEYYNGWPKGAAQPLDITMSSAGIFRWSRALRRRPFRGSKWCNDCSMPDNACNYPETTNNPVEFPCKIKFDGRQTTLDKHPGR